MFYALEVGTVTFDKRKYDRFAREFNVRIWKNQSLIMKTVVNHRGINYSRGKKLNRTRTATHDIGRRKEKTIKNTKMALSVNL